jgi:hypothetical protein
MSSSSCTRPKSSRTEIGRYLRLTGPCCGNGEISPCAEVFRRRTLHWPVLEVATAHADDTFAPHHWCPGQRRHPPTGPGQVVWDWNVCHTFFSPTTRWAMSSIHRRSDFRRVGRRQSTTRGDNTSTMSADRIYVPVRRSSAWQPASFSQLSFWLEFFSPESSWRPSFSRESSWRPSLSPGLYLRAPCRLRTAL